MPSRTRVRRVRVIAVVFIGVVVFLLYRRSSSQIEGYREYEIPIPDAIGGGAVLRPVAPEPPVRAPVFGNLGVEEPVGLSATSRQSKTTTEHFADASTHAAVANVQTTTSVAAAPPEPTPEADLPYQVDAGRVEVSVDPSNTVSAIYWSKQIENFPISSTIQLPKGTSKPFPRIQGAINKLSMYGADEEKLAVIKGAAAHSWKGYRENALGSDEIKPISQAVSNPFNGWGATLVDALDTLWVMGMKDEFVEAVEAVGRIDFTTTPRADIPLFETVIRYLGGLIAAYDVSDRIYIVLLDKAVELAEVLYGAFDTPNRVPLTYYQWRPAFASQPHRAGNRVVLAEIGTLSLEFTRLAQLTGEPKYYDAVARLTDLFEEWQNNTRLPGMWPTTFDASGCGVPSTPTKVEPPTQQPVEGSGSQVAPGVVVGSDGNRQESSQSISGAAGVIKGGIQDANDLRMAPNKPPQVKPAEAGVIKGAIHSWDDSIEEGVNRKRSVQLPPGVSANSTHHKHELRTPPDVDPGRMWEGSECIPQGFTTPNSMSESYTLSGASDSMYEYLPKEYILLGGQVEKYKTMYLDSAAVMIEKLLYKPMTPEERDILMTGELKIRPDYDHDGHVGGFKEEFRAEVAHLACFAGGMFAMGGVIFDKPEHVDIGSKITDGCVWAYNVTQTGIMPEAAEVMHCEDTWGQCKWNETAYWEILDPYEETRRKAQERKEAADAAAALKHAAEAAPALPTPPPIVAAPPTQAVPVIQEYNVDLNRKDDEPVLTKRQLVALSSFDDSPEPAPPVPAPAAIPDPTTTTTSHKLYPTPHAITHEEYVAQKILNERLPPAYIRMTSRKYILRPEAIESVFYMYRITGNPHWREVGWNMWRAVEKATRATYGHSAIDDVTDATPLQVDSMESFWMAETLKYFYLLFDDPDSWSLDDWVLNTEAHLFKRPEFDFVEPV